MTKVSRGSATGATTTEVCAPGLTWTKVSASTLSSRRSSMLKRYATTTSVFFVIKHDFKYFNMYFSSFTIRLAYPMPCKTLCLGEDGFWRLWKDGNKENPPKNPSWYGFRSKAVQFWEHNPFWLQKLGSTLQDVWFWWGYACHHESWWSYNRARETYDFRPCGYTSNSSSMWA